MLARAPLALAGGTAAGRQPKPPRAQPKPSPKPQVRKPQARQAPSPKPHARLWLAATALGVSGFASLTLQVVWTRLLVQILGPTTYAFSTVVSIFIIGLAGGAAIAFAAGVAHEPGHRPRVRPADQRRPRARRGVGRGLGAADHRRDRVASRIPIRRRAAARSAAGVGTAAADDPRLRRGVSVCRGALADRARDESVTRTTSASSTRSTRSARFSDRCCLVSC